MASEAVKGSPPPMRGKAVLPDAIITAVGITPAYAGKRKGTFAGMIPCEDHPRLCGEKAPHRAGKTVLLGSPPPMRGKEPQNVTSIKFYRITPAYAGKSISQWHRPYVCKDHPRLCGEKYQIGAFFASPLGSPPPMRGKGPRQALRQHADGITPAYAGKRSTGQ